MDKSKLKTQLRDGLLKEEKEACYEYGCVMAYLPVPKEWWDKIQEGIKEEDVLTGEDEDDDRYGREEEQHVTIIYGLHGDVPDSDVEALIDTLKAPEITLNKIGIFSNDNFDVVKFDVESADLKAANKEFVKLPNTTDYPDYHAHATICYVKPGTGEDYVRTLSKKESLTVKADKIIYSKADGTKKEYNF